MTVTIVATSVTKPPPDLIEALRNAPTSIISDKLARLAGSVGLRPFHRAGGWSAPPSRSEPAPATGRAADAVAR